MGDRCHETFSPSIIRATYQYRFTRLDLSSHTGCIPLNRHHNGYSAENGLELAGAYGRGEEGVVRGRAQSTCSVGAMGR